MQREIKYMKNFRLPLKFVRYFRIFIIETQNIKISKSCKNIHVSLEFYTLFQRLKNLKQSTQTDISSKFLIPPNKTH